MNVNNNKNLELAQSPQKRDWYGVSHQAHSGPFWQASFYTQLPSSILQHSLHWNNQKNDLVPFTYILKYSLEVPLPPSIENHWIQDILECPHNGRHFNKMVSVGLVHLLFLIRWGNSHDKYLNEKCRLQNSIYVRYPFSSLNKYLTFKVFHILFPLHILHKVGKYL